MAVAEPARGLGTGRRAFRNSEALARKAGAARVVLLTLVKTPGDSMRKMATSSPGRPRPYSPRSNTCGWRNSFAPDFGRLSFRTIDGSGDDCQPAAHLDHYKPMKLKRSLIVYLFAYRNSLNLVRQTRVRPQRRATGGDPGRNDARRIQGCRSGQIVPGRAGCAKQLAERLSRESRTEGGKKASEHEKRSKLQLIVSRYNGVWTGVVPGEMLLSSRTAQNGGSRTRTNIMAGVPIIRRSPSS